MSFKPGKGPAWLGAGVEFEVASEAATTIDLWRPGKDKMPLRRVSPCSWRVRVEDCGPGDEYGFLVDGGPLLVDPRARMLTADARPRSVVVDESFDWGGDVRPARSWGETVLYEAHVKGMTALHPDVEPSLRGTYLGLASPPVIAHLLALGVTAVELMPVHHSLTEARLTTQGLVNYWGYGSVGFFAPDVRFATAPGRQLAEFKEMVRRLHAAGLEVVLDVVFNHTIEGDEAGPVLALKGLDRGGYYRCGEQGDLTDWTGCGNTLDFRRPLSRELVRDALRYWVQEMHVDGFRFDLAPILGRGTDFLAELAEDPILVGTKRIAEPWDLGPDGYWLGQFPSGWSEWNDRFRDCVRRFWRGDAGQVGELATRLSGSVDLLPSPHRGVNFVACHDGFTLRDLVSFGRKANGANGEEGRDGTDQNWSRDHGARRGSVQRALIATVALSRGVPMLGHGDELGRTQEGNNNAYCHDSALTWVDWEGADTDLAEFVSRALALRRRHRSLGLDEAWRSGEIEWLDERGRHLVPEQWNDPRRRLLVMHVVGSLLVVMNAGPEARSCRLPGGPWLVALETTVGGGLSEDCLLVPASSLVALERDPS